MKFPYPIIKGKFLKREKRFFAYCLLESGLEVVAHCPNPGSMKGNLEPNSPVWLMDFGADHLSQGKKLRYKWVLVNSKNVNIVVDTMCANLVVGEALRNCEIPELKAYSNILPEKKVGDSRFDFFLPGEPDVYLEVKSVSMGEGNKGAFPDSVTERGQKHIRELMVLKALGHRVILFFLLMREGGDSVTTAKEIDPEYDRLLRDAVKKGLEVLVYAIKVDESGITLDQKGKSFE